MSAEKYKLVYFTAGSCISFYPKILIFTVNYEAMSFYDNGENGGVQV